MPAVLLVLAALLGCGKVLLTQLSCVDAARAGARVAARAEPDARVRVAAERLLPAPGSVEVGRGDGLVRVTVATAVPVPLPVSAIGVRCVAVAAAELP
jgi:hypothetical protein